MTKSRKQKKKFDCGHIGFGTYCHFCEQKEKQKKIGETVEVEENEH